MRLTLSGVLLVLVGCQGMPDLTFVPDEVADGAAGSPDGAPVGSLDGAADGAAVDATKPPPIGADSAAGSDSSSGGGADAHAGADTGTGGGVCPSQPPPPGVSACCGSVACVDHTNQGSCNDCTECDAKNCGAKVCCYDSMGNKLACKGSLSACK